MVPRVSLVIYSALRGVLAIYGTSTALEDPDGSEIPSHTSRSRMAEEFVPFPVCCKANSSYHPFFLEVDRMNYCEARQGRGFLAHIGCELSHH
ncbi:hypothetical protein CPB85DRAFT_1340519 [Mucidula mucida]|nr:hypothetical protein CPB85DRAFT_1340519 [Mucidula mucida]